MEEKKIISEKMVINNLILTLYVTLEVALTALYVLQLNQGTVSSSYF